MGYPTTYDKLIKQYAPDLPVAYVRALIASESDFKPDSVTPSSHATGLLQTVKVVLDDYNQAHHTAYTLNDMKTPELNIKVGGELLEKILHGYAKHPSLKMDWNNPRNVALFTAGFNAGYSDKAGIGYVAKHLEDAKVAIDRITVDTIQQAANALSQASRFLKESDRLNYWKTVTKRYFQEIDKPLKPSDLSKVSLEKESSPWPWVIIGSLVVGRMIYKKRKRHGR